MTRFAYFQTVILPDTMQRLFIMTTSNSAAPIITIKGPGKAKREAAYAQIAPLSFVENLSRVETIANLKVALGASPSDDEVKAARTEWQIGRVASRLPASEFPKDCKSADAKIAFARDLVLHYAAPPKEGAKARKLRAGQKGRRNAMQQRVIRAADEAWSQIKAELGAGNAQTQAERNKAKAKRAPHNNAKASDAKPNVAELPAAKDMSPAIVVDHVAQQLAALRAFCDKNAKYVPNELNEVVAGLANLRDKANAAKAAFAERNA